MIILKALIVLQCFSEICYSDEITYGNDLLLISKGTSLEIRNSDIKSCNIQDELLICPLKNVTYQSNVIKINEIIYEDSFSVQESL